MAEPTDGAPRGGGRSDATRESKPADRNDGSRDAARIERDRQAANNFRQMTQPERLQDRRMNAGAKAVAALDAAIVFSSPKSKTGTDPSPAPASSASTVLVVAFTSPPSQPGHTPSGSVPDHCPGPGSYR